MEKKTHRKQKDRRGAAVKRLALTALVAQVLGDVASALGGAARRLEVWRAKRPSEEAPA